VARRSMLGLCRWRRKEGSEREGEEATCHPRNCRPFSFIRRLARTRAPPPSFPTRSPFISRCGGALPLEQRQRPGGACAPRRGSARSRAEDTKERDVRGTPSRNALTRPSIRHPTPSQLARPPLQPLSSLPSPLATASHCPGLHDRPILFSASQRAALNPTYGDEERDNDHLPVCSQVDHSPSLSLSLFFLSLSLSLSLSLPLSLSLSLSVFLSICQSPSVSLCFSLSPPSLLSLSLSSFFFLSLSLSLSLALSFCLSFFSFRLSRVLVTIRLAHAPSPVTRQQAEGKRIVRREFTGSPTVRRKCAEQTCERRKGSAREPIPAVSTPLPWSRSRRSFPVSFVKSVRPARISEYQSGSAAA